MQYSYEKNKAYSKQKLLSVLDIFILCAKIFTMKRFFYLLLFSLLFTITGCDSNKCYTKIPEDLSIIKDETTANKAKLSWKVVKLKNLCILIQKIILISCSCKIVQTTYTDVELYSGNYNYFWVRSATFWELQIF